MGREGKKVKQESSRRKKFNPNLNFGTQGCLKHKPELGNISGAVKTEGKGLDQKGSPNKRHKRRSREIKGGLLSLGGHSTDQGIEVWTKGVVQTGKRFEPKGEVQTER